MVAVAIAVPLWTIRLELKVLPTLPSVTVPPPAELAIVKVEPPVIAPFAATVLPLASIVADWERVIVWPIVKLVPACKVLPIEVKINGTVPKLVELRFRTPPLSWTDAPPESPFAPVRVKVPSPCLEKVLVPESAPLIVTLKLFVPMIAGALAAMVADDEVALPNSRSPPPVAKITLVVLPKVFTLRVAPLWIVVVPE